MRKRLGLFKTLVSVPDKIFSFFANISARTSTAAVQYNEMDATLYLEQEPHIVFENCACYTLSMRMKLDAENLPMPLCVGSVMEYLLENYTVFTYVSELNQAKKAATEMSKSEALDTPFCVSYAQQHHVSSTAEETLFLTSENELLAITPGMNQRLVSALDTARSMGLSILCSQTGFAQIPPDCVYQQQQEANAFLVEMPEDITLQYPWSNWNILIAISTEQEREDRLIQTLKAVAFKINRKLQVLFPVDGTMLDI